MHYASIWELSILGIVPTFVDARKLMTEAVLGELQRQYGDRGIPILPPIRVDSNLAKAAASIRRFSNMLGILGRRMVF